MLIVTTDIYMTNKEKEYRYLSLITQLHARPLVLYYFLLLSVLRLHDSISLKILWLASNNNGGAGMDSSFQCRKKSAELWTR
jgi:hypothetical protein